MKVGMGKRVGWASGGSRFTYSCVYIYIYIFIYRDCCHQTTPSLLNLISVHGSVHVRQGLSRATEET